MAQGLNDTVLHLFQGGEQETTPSSGVILDGAGNLYGVTSDGGMGGCNPLGYCGTVYQLAPDGHGNWNETILHEFQGNTGNDGAEAGGNLLLDSAGNLYGTTGYGGTGGCVLLGVLGGCGTVFELSPPSKPGGEWKETILYSFQGGSDGYVPAGSLVFDAAGNLYGATAFGGGQGKCDPFYEYCGTVFELSPPAMRGEPWTEKVLYSFKGGPDGIEPVSPIFDKQGNLYGITLFGGILPSWNGCPPNINGDGGCGTLYKLEPGEAGQWKETVLYRFGASRYDAAGPRAGLAIDSNGSLYGTTAGGGHGEQGTVFQLSPPPSQGGVWTETIIISFTGLQGVAPFTAPILDKQGRLYGTTQAGGLYDAGTVYRLNPRGPITHPSWDYEILCDFPTGNQVEWPNGRLTFDKDGSLYGTGQVYNHQVIGSVFRVGP